MGLDFYYTCPNIDKAIKEFQEDIHDILFNIITEAFPLIDVIQLKELIKQSNDTYVQVFNNYAEDIRTLNQDIRLQAEKQIEELEDKLSELQEEYYDLENEKEQLERELSELK